MSWSVGAVGKPKAVAAKLAAEFAISRCAEPEESIRQLAGSAIATALGSFCETCAVKVEAGGSQNTVDSKPVSNSLNVKIEPIWGFVE